MKKRFKFETVCTEISCCDVTVEAETEKEARAMIERGEVDQEWIKNYGTEESNHDIQLLEKVTEIPEDER